MSARIASSDYAREVLNETSFGAHQHPSVEALLRTHTSIEDAWNAATSVVDLAALLPEWMTPRTEQALRRFVLLRAEEVRHLMTNPASLRALDAARPLQRGRWKPELTEIGAWAALAVDRSRLPDLQSPSDLATMHEHTAAGRPDLRNTALAIAQNWAAWIAWHTVRPFTAGGTILRNGGNRTMAPAAASALALEMLAQGATDDEILRFFEQHDRRCLTEFRTLLGDAWRREYEYITPPRGALDRVQRAVREAPVSSALGSLAVLAGGAFLLRSRRSSPK